MNDVKWKQIQKALRVFEKHDWIVDKCELVYDVEEGTALRLNLVHDPPQSRPGFGS